MYGSEGVVWVTVDHLKKIGQRWVFLAPRIAYFMNLTDVGYGSVVPSADQHLKKIAHCAHWSGPFVV